ncbi:Na+/H+ antiporter [Kutzneria kofuensis]|uniref:CPA1 family monovalent cation:H+ antiporter n=1 Tax=Kutzneria kofuensis TaxID=103725 RepID=A0A7W9NLA5_9PSEU|nr:Na+/H+ antiporter [Kutzneria kofuensis]MBB5897472.1 CPA1 family monovalent cation:H+ antiporter [Kutzneria kofuensis]
MLGLELVVALGVAVLVSGVVAQRFRVAPPVVLLTCGALLGFVPAVLDVHLPSEVVLLLFLPALLYWESLTTSLREIRFNLRGIVLVSTVLVVVTAGAVAATAHWLGMPWGPAWVLGAAVAPTDATAVGVLARMLPRRLITVLRAESLVNDGTALVIFAIAVGVTVGQEEFDAVHVGGLFLLAYLGGAAAGVVTATAMIPVRRRLADPLLANVAMILTPFLAFLLAEAIEASGVLAVVTAGLIMSQVGPRIGRAETRQLSQGFWGLATFILNGALFVLVGLESHAAVRGLASANLVRGLITVGAVCVVLVAVRIVFLFVSVYIIRAVDRRPSQRLRRVSHRSRIVSGLSGFRGAVSLAAALAVPETVVSGAGFPDRDMIVFVTAGVIIVTLVAQGLVLPGVVRWAHLPQDNSVAEERLMAQRTATEEAMAAMPLVAEELGTDPDVVERLNREFQKHLHVLHAGTEEDDADGPALRHDQHYTALRLALLARKRATVVRLRDENRIDDTVLRQIQARLDIEEVRLSQRELVD